MWRGAAAVVSSKGMVRMTRLPGKMALRSEPYHLSRNRWIQKKQSVHLDDKGCAPQACHLNGVPQGVPTRCGKLASAPEDRATNQSIVLLWFVATLSPGVRYEFGVLLF